MASTSRRGVKRRVPPCFSTIWKYSPYCSLCANPPLLFSNPIRASAHFAIEHFLYLCPYPLCARKFSTELQLLRHDSKFHKSHDIFHRCGACLAQFSTIRGFDSHIKTIHPDLDNSTFPLQYTCIARTRDGSACTKTFIKLHQLKKHIITVHRIGWEGKTQLTPSTRSQFCGSCHQSTNFQAERLAFDAHYRNEHNEELIDDDGIIATNELQNQRRCRIVLVFYGFQLPPASEILTRLPRGFVPNFVNQFFYPLRQGEGQTVPSSAAIEAACDLPFHCLLCTSKFTRAATLKDHVLRVHSAVPLYPNFNLPPAVEQESSSDSGSDDDDDAEKYLMRLSELIEVEPRKLYVLTSPPIRRGNSYFKTEEVEYCYKYSRRGLRLAVFGFGEAVFESIIHHLVAEFFHRNGLIRLFLNSGELDFPLRFPPSRPTEQLLGQFMQEISRILMSKRELLTAHPMDLRVTYIPLSKLVRMGYAVKTAACRTFQEFCQRTSSCWNPENRLFTCLGSCIVAFLLLKELGRGGNKLRRQKWFVRKGNTRVFRDRVDTLYSAAAISPNVLQTLEDVQTFQDYLNSTHQLQIILYDGSEENSISFCGEPVRAYADRIHIAVFDEHAGLILNLSRFLKKKVCEQCGCIYSKTAAKHTCIPECRIGVKECETSICLNYETLTGGGAQGTSTGVYCDGCDIGFRNSLCFHAHKRNGVCQRRKKCTVCHEIFERIYEWSHECAEDIKCHFCGVEFPAFPPHNCTVQRPKASNLRSETDDYRVIIFDFETFTSDPDGEQGAYGVLSPYLVVAIVLCPACLLLDHGLWEFHDCQRCGPRFRIFYGPAEIDAFMLWLFYDPTKAPATRYMAFSFNGSRFDSFFVLDWLLKTGRKPHMNLRNGRLLSLSFNKTILKDFCCFCPMTLASLSKAFDLPSAKGYFAWRLAAPRLLDDIFPTYPHPYYFGVDKFTDPAEMSKFKAWHAARANKTYNFRMEAIAYCRADCVLLAQAFVSYRKVSLVLSRGRLDACLSSCTTLASFASMMYREVYMPNTECIGLIPPSGYYTNQKQSDFATKIFQWLNFQRQKAQQPLIRTKYSVGGEKRIGPFLLDGYVAEEKTAYEVHGCFFKSCHPCGFRGDRPHPYHGISHQAVRQKRLAREGLLKKHPSIDRLLLIWEHDIPKMIRFVPLFELFWAGRSPYIPLSTRMVSIRESLFGGVTETFRRRLTLTPKLEAEGWTINFDDSFSMYPYIQMARDYPGVPHPEIQTNPVPPVSGVDGDWTLDDVEKIHLAIMSVNILPPKDLLYPTLPTRLRGKTVFPLCFTCARENNQARVCNHPVPQRSIIGSYTSIDIITALKLGYKLISVFEIMTWAAAPARKDLFRAYIQAMIRTKLVSSGWPKDCKTARQKRAYLREWKERVGVDVKAWEIKINPPQRQQAKLLLVSLWGKLAQFVPATEIRYVSSYKELQELLNDPKVTVSDIDFGVDSRIAAVTFSLHKDEVLASPFTNCAIASFVTAWGREYLFSVIHYLYPFVLYCDTDSVIYLFNRFRHNPLPQRGRILGDFQTEIPDGLKITAYHALSPKNYHLRFENLETGEITRKWKCKGVSSSIMVRKAMREDVFEALMECRLEDLLPFYQRLLSADGSERVEAVARARYLYDIQQSIDTVSGLTNDPGAIALFAPSPGIRRSLGAVVKLLSDEKGCKAIKLENNPKRIHLPSIADQTLSSLPFGFVKE